MATRQKKPIILAQLPQIPKSLPVYEVRAATLEERTPAIQLFQRRLKLDEPRPVRVEESLRFVSKRGEVEFYRPSGAVWAYDYAAKLDYKDERRSWDSKIIETEEGPYVVLTEDAQKQIVGNAEKLFREVKFLNDFAAFADVVVDQVHTHSADGKKDIFPGEATVRFLYRVQDFPVAGPGAKTYAFFNDSERMVGAFHGWRDVVGEHKVETHPAEVALDGWFKQDTQIASSLKRGKVVEISAVELVYYALPPSKFQDYVFPTLRVTGFIYDGKNRENGLQFARFCHAIPPEQYARANVFADTLMIRP